MLRKAVLPSWARAIGPGRIEIDAAEFYPAFLKELQVAEEDVDQYWLEVVFQCAKMDVQVSVLGTDLMPTLGGALVILVKDTTKAESPDGTSKWAQRKYPEGRGVLAASKQLGAREHYRKIRASYVSLM